MVKVAPCPGTLSAKIVPPYSITMPWLYAEAQPRPFFNFFGSIKRVEDTAYGLGRYAGSVICNNHDYLPIDKFCIYSESSPPVGPVHKILCV